VANEEGNREVTCAAVYTRVGLDLRLLERGEMLRTELFHDGPSRKAGIAAPLEERRLANPVFPQ